MRGLLLSGTMGSMLIAETNQLGAPTLEELIAIVGGEVLEIDDPGFLTADPAAPFDLLYGDHPPLEWFGTLPDGFGPDDPPYVDEAGRVAAVAWPYDRCHVGYTDAGLCVTLPPSPSGNHLFHQGNTVTAEGVLVKTGFLGLWGHDQDPDHTVEEAQAHYNDPLLAGARGRILETPEAAYFVGALKPGVTYGQAETIRGGALSGDWRWIPELDAYDALGPCLVARPGLPTTYRADASVDAGLFWDLVYRVTDPDETGMISTRPEWVPRTLKEIQAMAKPRKIQLVTVGAGSRKPVQALASGQTYEEARTALAEAVKAAHAAGEDQWAWVVDFDEENVIFEVEGDGVGKMMQSFTLNDDGSATLSGTPSNVKVQYVPGREAAPAADTEEEETEAPVTASAACGCKTPKRPKISAAGEGESTDDGARLSALETLVAELQAQIARIEADKTQVDDVIEIPQEAEAA